MGVFTIPFTKGGLGRGSYGHRQGGLGSEDLYGNDDAISYGTEEAPKYSFDDLKPYLAMLPPKDCDVFVMSYLLKKDQKEIAKILKLTQGGVSHRLAKARERLAFMIRLPKFTQTQMRQDLKQLVPLFPGMPILEMLWGLYTTSCQSITGDNVGMTQSIVRSRFLRVISILTKVKRDDLQPYLTAFIMLKENPNILREVNIPKWKHKNGDYKDIKSESTPNIAFSMKPK